MTAIVLTLVIAAELILLARAIRSFGFLPSPTFILMAILMEQLTLELVSTQVLENAFLWTYSNGGVFTAFYPTEFLYSGLFFFYYLSHLRLGDGASPRARSLAISPRLLDAINLPAAAFIAGAQIALALVLNWGIAWHNNRYLAMGDGSIALIDRRLSFMLVIFFAAGVTSMTLSALNFAARKKPWWGCGFLALSFFPVLYQLGAHSRGAAVFPLMFGLTLYAVTPARFRKTKVAAVLTSLLFVATALVGRLGYDHGLSTTPRSVIHAFSDGPRTASNLVTSVFEGSSVIAESLTTPAEFSLRYKVLSLAPTPSFIDGFADGRASMEHRLSVYAPMSGIVELDDFGLVYVIAFLIIVFGSTRIVFSQAGRNHAVFVVSNLLLFVSFITLNTYSARSGLKWIWLADALVGAGVLLKMLETPAPGSLRSAVPVASMNTGSRS